MAQPIGISFIPTAANQATGPQQNSLEGGGGSDLAQAFKILSLRLPQFLGAGSLAPQRLLTAPGATGPTDPNAAVLKALLLALAGGQTGFGAGTPGISDPILTGAGPTGPVPPPNITPGSGLPKVGPPAEWTFGPSDPNAVTSTGGQNPYRRFYGGESRTMGGGGLMKGY